MDMGLKEREREGGGASELLFWENSWIFFFFVKFKDFSWLLSSGSDGNMETAHLSSNVFALNPLEVRGQDLTALFQGSTACLQSNQCKRCLKRLRR